jgi:hypothetical protein
MDAHEDEIDRFGGIYDGTVGWEDGADHYDIEDSGVPLIKVTLFEGAGPIGSAPRDGSRAHGVRVQARIDPTKDEIPEDGETVLVAIPARRMLVPGAPVILKSLKPDPKFVPNRKPGEKQIYGSKNAFVRFKDDGSIYLFTREENTEAGKTIYARLSPDGFEIEHPHMRASFGPNGFHAVHSSGARVDLGAIGGLPAPLDALSSYAKLAGAIIQLEASGVTIGPAGTPSDPLAKSTPLLLTLDAINAALVAIGSALTALGNTSAGTAVAAATAAIVSAHGTVPSASTAAS